MKRILVIVMTMLFASILNAQGDTVYFKDRIEVLSVEGLMNIPIVSASREKESAFDAPLSTCVITSKEIMDFGGTSIPDVLRICPGVIVREISNGTYDVSIRGGNDGLPAYDYNYINSTLLVMIDNRPVFSSFQGGTYWQNLSIGLTDIERIEVVNGPASPLYGPNAVQGVINIITKKTEEGARLNAIAHGGSNVNQISLSAGTNITDKLSLDLGANYDYRKRFENSYYDDLQQKYTVLDSLNASMANNALSYFPEEDIALRKFSAMIALNYEVNKKVNFNLSTASNQNAGLMPLATRLPVAYFTNTSENWYLRGNIYGLTVQASTLYGRQGLTGTRRENSYQYQNNDLYVDYDFKVWNKKLSIRPACSYQSFYANDKKYTIEKGKNGTFNGAGTIENYAASLKVDTRPIHHLRVVLAGRLDLFNYPQKIFPSWQAIVNYKVRRRHLFRVVYSRSNNGSFLVSTLLNSKSALGPGTYVDLQGNKNLNLLNNTLYELGYRVKMNSNHILDVSLFFQHFKDFNTLIALLPSSDANGVTLNYQHQNLPLQAMQCGATFSTQSGYLQNKILLRAHVTVQQTQLSSFSQYYNEKGAYDYGSYTFAGSRDSLYTKSHDGAPVIWMGANFTFKPLEKILLNVSTSYYALHTIHMNIETNFQNGQVMDQKGSYIADKFLINAQLAYHIQENLSVFGNVRNLLNADAPEGFGSDKLGALYSVGLKLNY